MFGLYLLVIYSDFCTNHQFQYDMGNCFIYLIFLMIAVNLMFMFQKAYVSFMLNRKFKGIIKIKKKLLLSESLEKKIVAVIKPSKAKTDKKATAQDVKLHKSEDEIEDDPEQYQVIKPNKDDQGKAILSLNNAGKQGEFNLEKARKNKSQTLKKPQRVEDHPKEIVFDEEDERLLNEIAGIIYDNH